MSAHVTEVFRVYTLGAMSARARFRASCKTCGWTGQMRQARDGGAETAIAARDRARKDGEKHLRREKAREDAALTHILIGSQCPGCRREVDSPGAWCAPCIREEKSTRQFEEGR